MDSLILASLIFFAVSPLTIALVIWIVQTATPD